ncbi:hypothetical protein [Pleomorphomonas sp. NRK KF1]|uniref:hypothetical protein n=1 Tax=Pleomorphomonas sp. NRK KF1 TaxID=2943000 RepID=UPI002043663A|nr:hypothetical protein [Pleomorphomonas sp. NRK KF1]
MSDIFSPRIGARHETARMLHVRIREMCCGPVKKMWMEYANYAKNCRLRNRLPRMRISAVIGVIRIAPSTVENGEKSKQSTDFHGYEMENTSAACTV